MGQKRLALLMAKLFHCFNQRHGRKKTLAGGANQGFFFLTTGPGQGLADISATFAVLPNIYNDERRTSTEMKVGVSFVQVDNSQVQ